jgi:hypothetical protein
MWIVINSWPQAYIVNFLEFIGLNNSFLRVKELVNLKIMTH